MSNPSLLPYEKNGKKSYYNEIIMIGANNQVRTLKMLKNQIVTAMFFHTSAKILYFAAGDKGRNSIYSLNIDSLNTQKIYTIRDHSVSAFTSAPTGDVYFTSATGKAIYRLSASYPKEGYYYTDVFDGYQTVNWGRVIYSAYHSYNSKYDPYVKIMARTGNSYLPDDGWSEWKKISDKGVILNKPSRFIQLKLILKKIDNDKTPIVSDIKLYYGREPQAPVIQAIALGKNYKLAKKHNISLQVKEMLLYWKVSAFNNYQLRYDVYYLKTRGKKNKVNE